MTRIAVTMLILTLAGPQALAAPAAKQSTDELLKQARKAFNSADFHGAVRRYEQAVSQAERASERAAIRCELGVAFATLGKSTKAAVQFRLALTEDPTVRPERESTKPAIFSLFEDVRQQLKGTLDVSATVPGSVWIGNNEVGPLPLSRKLSIGSYRIEIRSSTGDVLFTKDETIVHKGKTTSLHFDPEKEGRGGNRLWTWITLGTAAAAAGIGIGFGIAAKSAHDDYQSTNDPGRLDELDSQVRTRSNVANAMFLTSGILALGAVVLYFVEPHLSTPQESDDAYCVTWRREPSSGEHQQPDAFVLAAQFGN